MDRLQLGYKFVEMVFFSLSLFDHLQRRGYTAAFGLRQFYPFMISHLLIITNLSPRRGELRDVDYLFYFAVDSAEN